MSEQEGRSRTITLYDRPPVRIREDEWPIMAAAEWAWHDGEVESQANRKHYCLLRVRQDRQQGRTVVYGVARYVTNWQREEPWEYRGGQLLDTDSGTMMANIVAAIREVGNRVADSIPDEDTARHMRELVDECIADLPAEEL